MKLLQYTNVITTTRNARVKSHKHSNSIHFDYEVVYAVFGEIVIQTISVQK